MESIYLGIVLFLFLLAIFDLVVGVSNDAVNFLGSAVGARAASFKWIMGCRFGRSLSKAAAVDKNIKTERSEKLS